MSASQPRWIPQTFGARTYERMNLEHPEFGDRVVEEIESGTPVYYDREWPMTRRFCGWLADNPSLVEGKRVVVVGAGVGMEAVVVGDLADRIWVNDMAPVALELLVEQLEHNGIDDPGTLPGSFGDIALPDGADMVLGCFVLYDRSSADAMRSLVRSAGEAGVPLLLADQDIGGHFSAILAESAPHTTVLADGDDLRVALFE